MLVSDKVLKSKLQEYGFSVGPITETTRSLYMKKLKNFESSVKNTRASTESTTRFNSLQNGYYTDDNDNKKKSTLPSSTKITASNTSNIGDWNTVGKSSSTVKNHLSQKPKCGSDTANSFKENRNYTQHLSKPPSYTTPFHYNSMDRSAYNDDDDDEEDVNTADSYDVKKVYKVYNDNSESAQTSCRFRENYLAGCSEDDQCNSPRNVCKVKDRIKIISMRDMVVGHGNMCIILSVILFLGCCYTVWFWWGFDTKQNNVFTQYRCKHDENPTTQNCMSSRDWDRTKSIIGHMYDILNLHSGNYRCGQHDHPYMTVADAKKKVENELRQLQDSIVNADDNFSISTFIWSQVLKWLLGSENTHLNIVVLDANGLVITDNQQADKAIFLEGTQPKMSPYCRLYYSVWKFKEVCVYGVLQFFNYMVLIIYVMMAVLCLCGLLYGLYHLRLKQLKEKNQKTNTFMRVVNKIKDILRKQANDSSISTNVPPFMSVNVLKDVALRGEKLCELSSTFWKRVVDHIYDNECECIAFHDKPGLGEVWQWNGQLNYFQHHETNGNTWKSSAGSLSRSPISLTSNCLMIKNLRKFNNDHTEDWTYHIRQELLKICCQIGDVFHIAVQADADGKSAITYLKFSTPDCAFEAYTRLNSTCFEGSILDVQCIPSDIYHRKFPSSQYICRPLFV